MDLLMLFGFAVDLALWTLAGYLLARFGKRFLPDLLKDKRITMTLFFSLAQW